MAGASLREAASALGMSRARLLRFINEGLPVRRRSERVFVNLSEARDWLALNDLGGPVKRAGSILDKSDPRWPERAAAARLAHLKNCTAAGLLVDRAAATQRYSDELVSGFRTEILRLPQRLSATADRATNMQSLEDGIEECLAPLRMDQIEAWKINARAADRLARVEAESSDGDEGEADGDRHTLPIMSPADPRSRFAQAAANRRELELSDYELSTVPLHHVLRLAGRTYEAVRERVRQIPTLVDLADGSFIDAVNQEIDNALVELSMAQAGEQTS